MNVYKLQQLKEQRREVRELLSLFERAAFRPDDGNNGGDPTAALNGIYETRIALQKRGAAFVENEHAAQFFSDLQGQLLELENEVRAQFPQVMDLAIQWRGKPINTTERIASIQEALGDSYVKSAMFIRGEAFKVYDSPEKARHILAGIDSQINSIIQNEDKRAKKVGVLFLAASPATMEHLKSGVEFDTIKKILAHDEKLRLELPALALRPADISREMLGTEAQIVHFSGHGTEEGELCFEGADRHPHPVEPDALASLFEQFAPQVNCVVLIACYSERQARAIARHINYVIGVNRKIGDDAAIQFTAGFYKALSAGRSIEIAYKLGCDEIELHDPQGPLKPILFKREQARP